MRVCTKKNIIFYLLFLTVDLICQERVEQNISLHFDAKYLKYKTIMASDLEGIPNKGNFAFLKIITPIPNLTIETEDGREIPVMKKLPDFDFIVTIPQGAHRLLLRSPCFVDTLLREFIFGAKKKYVLYVTVKDLSTNKKKSFVRFLCDLEKVSVKIDG